MWKATIIVTYKTGILDPEAKTIQQALGSLGYTHIEDLHAGRFFEITLSGELSQANADARIKEICTKVLSNPVIQQYRYELNGERE